MAHRGCNQTYIRVFIINGLLKCHFGKAVQKTAQGRTKKLFDLPHAVLTQKSSFLTYFEFLF